MVSPLPVPVPPTMHTELHTYSMYVHTFIHTSVGWFSQEPPKEDLTVSEKFQLVLDVAQKAQVAPAPLLGTLGPASKRLTASTHSVCLKTLLFSEPVWQDGGRAGEDQEVGEPPASCLMSSFKIVYFCFIFFSLSLCFHVSACSCGCSRRAPGSFTSACGWRSSAPASCRTSSWAS